MGGGGKASQGQVGHWLKKRLSQRGLKEGKVELAANAQHATRHSTVYCYRPRRGQPLKGDKAQRGGPARSRGNEARVYPSGYWVWFVGRPRIGVAQYLRLDKIIIRYFATPVREVYQGVKFVSRTTCACFCRGRVESFIFGVTFTFGLIPLKELSNPCISHTPSGGC